MKCMLFILKLTNRRFCMDSLFLTSHFGVNGTISVQFQGDLCYSISIVISQAISVFLSF